MYSKANSAFQNMLCQSAMEGTDKLLKQRDFYINKDYKLVKEFNCMNETPALMPVNIYSLVGKKWRKKKKQVKKI